MTRIDASELWRIIITFATAVLVVTAVTAPQSLRAEAPPPQAAKALLSDVTYDVNAKPDFRRFLVYAVAHGLIDDRVSAEQARALATEAVGKIFVPKCPICMSVEDGLEAYARAVASSDAPPPPGLSAEAWEALSSGDAKTRHEAVRDLIAGHVRRAFERLAMTPDQIAAMRDLLEGGRKEGMSGLSPGFGSDFCPSCDGAAVAL